MVIVGHLVIDYLEKNTVVNLASLSGFVPFSLSKIFEACIFFNLDPVFLKENICISKLAVVGHFVDVFEYFK